jgi:hypothetical protein
VKWSLRPEALAVNIAFASGSLPLPPRSDDHVELHGHYYSVPYELMHERVDARLTVTTVELFHRGQRYGSTRDRRSWRRPGPRSPRPDAQSPALADGPH